MPICLHHGCRRKLPGFNGPTTCEHCRPPLLHLISDFRSITSHTPGNNDDTNVNRNDGDDSGNSDSKRKTRSSNRLLYEKGLAQVLGMNFQKEDIPGGQLMIVKSAAAGFPMAVAHCHLYGLKQGKKRKRETDINYKKRRVKAGKWETDMNYNKRREMTAFKMLVTIEKEAHYHWSQYFLGVCYDKAWGTKKNYTKAVEWYSKSVEKGNNGAMNNLGYCYEKGLGVTKDMTKAFELYEQSALLGYNTGMYNVGKCYHFGSGVTKDINKAFEWYTKSTDQGHSFAMNNLGFCYQRGRGVDQDKTKAFELYEQSALLGVSAAMHTVGICYEGGQGVAKDLNKAKEWFTKGAAQGDAYSQNKLDALKEWFTKGAAQGDAYSKNKLDA